MHGIYTHPEHTPSLLCRGAQRIRYYGHRGGILHLGMTVTAHHAATVVRIEPHRLWSRHATPDHDSQPLVARITRAGTMPEPYEIVCCGEPFGRGDFPHDTVGILFSNKDHGIAFRDFSKRI